MPSDLPANRHYRRQPLAQGTGQGIDERLREAIEVRLALQEHTANTVDGWTPEA
jgi:hypothetical protein